MEAECQQLRDAVVEAQAAEHKTLRVAPTSTSINTPAQYENSKIPRICVSSVSSEAIFTVQLSVVQAIQVIVHPFDAHVVLCVVLLTDPHGREP